MDDESSKPETRARSGMIGRRVPRTGTEPVTARSALRLRLLLSAVFLPVFAAVALLLGSWATASDPGSSPGRAVLVTLTVGCGVLALAAALDLLVVARRLRRERGGRR